MPSLSERLPIFFLHLFSYSQENSPNAPQSMDLEHCSIQFLLIAKHLSQFCSARAVLGQICVLWSRPCAHEFCVWMDQVFLQTYKFRGQYFISHCFVSFSFLYSTVIVFIFVKPDHTSQNKQIIQISSRMYIYSFTYKSM